MSRHDERVRLSHMLDYARKAVAMARGRKRSELDSNEMLQFALIHLVEIVGEAASKISLETRQNHNEIPWPAMVGMRNRLIHGYEMVDLDLLWDTLIHDLPPLIVTLSHILEENE